VAADRQEARSAAYRDYAAFWRWLYSNGWILAANQPSKFKASRV
jgi:hypothetical protein